MTPEIITVPLATIRTDGGTQARAGLDARTVAEYVEALTGGASFPPVDLVRDGAELWLADGFHRVEAHRQAGRETIAARVTVGTLRDAVLAACGANAAHGLRRSNADKRRAVLRLLEDPEWSRWSDREIARRCGVTHPFVANLRRELVEVVTVTTPDDSPDDDAIAVLAAKLAGFRPPFIGRSPDRATNIVCVPLDGPWAFPVVSVEDGAGGVDHVYPRRGIRAESVAWWLAHQGVNDTFEWATVPPESDLAARWSAEFARWRAEDFARSLEVKR